MKCENLFGEMVDIKPPEPEGYKSQYQIFKKKNRYRLANDNLKCKNCLNCEGWSYHDKTYYKCKLMGFSSSEATDIRLKNVCDKHSMILR